MKRYKYKNWEIITNENLPDASVWVEDEDEGVEKNIEKHLYLFRAPLDATKMVSYIPRRVALAGQIESIEDCRPLDLESVLALNLNLFEHRQRKQAENSENSKEAIASESSPLESIQLNAILEFLETLKSRHHKKKNVTLLGLGDVGSMLAIGLKLLGGEAVETLGIFDISEAQKSRWEMELNQITVNPDLRIKALQQNELFLGDVFIFCASKAVPKVGEEGKDVRMIQFEENAKLISIYARMAREANFEVLFAVVSDPVDLLCKQVYTHSHLGLSSDEPDYLGLLPEQVVGFGLGVMDGRAHYYSKLLGMNYDKTGRVFGPHGKDLIVSENVSDKDQEKSMILTQRVVEANLEMRALGYKPYIAPAISSGAATIANLLAGKPQYSARYIKGVYWGCKNIQKDYGVELEHLMITDALMSRIRTSYTKLEDTWKELNS